MTGFSLSAFRDFCAAKPEGERYCPTDLADKIENPAADLDVRSTLYLRVNARPRTYGALTARLDALIEGEKK